MVWDMGWPSWGQGFASVPAVGALCLVLMQGFPGLVGNNLTMESDQLSLPITIGGASGCVMSAALTATSPSKYPRAILEFVLPALIVTTAYVLLLTGGGEHHTTGDKKGGSRPSTTRGSDYLSLLIPRYVGQSRRAFIGSLLFFLTFLVAAADAVCPTCGGNLASCDYDTSHTCPAATVVANNAKVLLGTAAVSTMTIANLLRPRFLRVLGGGMLQRFVALHRQPEKGTTFEIKRTTKPSEVTAAMQTGRISQIDAATQIQQVIEEIDQAIDTAGDDAAKALLEREKEKWTDYLKGGFKYVTSATESDGLSGPEGTSVTGSMSLLWANVSTFISRGESCDRADVTTVTGRGGGTKATIAYVKTEAEFAACLNLFVMLAIAVSIPAIPLCEFIYLVVHDSVLRRDRTWQFAVVLLVVYLRKIEESGGRITLAKATEEVHTAAMYEEAERVMPKHYPGVAFFRTRGGTPRAEGPPATPPSTPSPAPRVGGAGPSSVKKPYNGKFTPGGRTCSAFNVGREHQARELFADGTCKFDHVCDHWVNNKGKAGQCRNSAGTPGHSRATCDNPHGCDNALP